MKKKWVFQIFTRTRFFLWTLLVFSFEKLIYSIPVSFQKFDSGSMSNVQWNFLQSPLVKIYYDNDAHDLARYALTSLNHCYPYISTLLGVKFKNDFNLNGSTFAVQMQKEDVVVSSFNGIVAIIGNKLNGPGFANPVTMNIEAQMAKPYDESFFCHELTHRLMYEHNDFSIGPLGRIWSLAMFPSWWIEGLAEYFTKSFGKYESQTLLMHMALNREWPTWERLHALYNASSDENERGYVTSGAFMEWLFNKVSEKNLGKIHTIVAHNTIVPPFYNAVDRFLLENTGKVSEDLYKDFKDEQEKFWRLKTASLTPLEKKHSFLNIYEQDFSSDVSEVEHNVLISHRAKKDESLQGNQIVFDLRTQKKSREFLKDDLYEITKNILESEESSPKFKDVKINQIKKVNSQDYFVEFSSKGKDYLYFFNEVDNKVIIKKLKSLQVPGTARIIGTKAENQEIICAVYILSKDFNKTSLHEICTNEKEKLLYPSSKYYFTDGFINTNNKVILLGYKNEYPSLLKLENGQIQLLGSFPNRVTNIYSSQDPNIFYAWIYSKEKFKLSRIALKDLSQNKEKASQNPIDTKAQFIAVLKEKQPLFAQNLLSPGESLLPSSLSQVPKTNNSEPAASPAPFDSTFVFAYPYLLPSFLGGPSVHLLAFPLQDSMERYRFQVYGGYYFNLKAPSGSISFVTSRILDGLNIELGAFPFFNGQYTSQTTNSLGQVSEEKKLNILSQYILSEQLFFKPINENSRFSTKLSFSKIEPYATADQIPTGFGVQKTYLAAAELNGSFSLLTKAFYLSKNSDPTEEQAFYQLLGFFEVGKYYGLISSKNSNDQNESFLNYSKFMLSVKNKFDFLKQNFSLWGKLSSTQGSKTFYLKEYYSPLLIQGLDSGLFLSEVFYPLYSKENIYNILQNKYAYSYNFNWTFPLASQYESLLFMAYINHLRGFLEFAQGGVMENFSQFGRIKKSSLSTGVSMDVDIKGVLFSPSLVYTTLLNESGWGLFFKLKFADFF